MESYMNLELKRKFIENFAIDIERSLLDKCVIDGGFPWYIFFQFKK